MPNPPATNMLYSGNYHLPKRTKPPTPKGEPPKRQRAEALPLEIRDRIVEMRRAGRKVSEILEVLSANGYYYTKDSVNQMCRRARVWVTAIHRERYPSEVVDKAVALYVAGHSATEVARQISAMVNHPTTATAVRNWCRSRDVYGIVPQDPALWTIAESSRRAMARERMNGGAKVKVKEDQGPAVDRAAAQAHEADNPLRLRWLPVIEAAVRRFGSMTKYLAHLRDIARLRYCEGADDATICERFAITMTDLATDASHPFSEALAVEVWNRPERYPDAHPLTAAGMETLLRSGVPLAAVVRLGDSYYDTARLMAVARRLGYA